MNSRVSMLNRTFAAALIMLNRIIIGTTLFVLLGGCAGIPYIKPVPGDYIVEQDITSVRNKLNKSLSHDYFIWYQGGTDEFSQEEQQNLLNWINNEKPAMICLRGTGGSEEYRTLAENRAQGVISYLQEQQIGIDIIKLDYDPYLRGGRVLINQISPQFAEEIKQTAPILVIKSD